MLLGLMIIAIALPAYSIKPAPRYRLFRNIALDSSTNRFYKCVYTAGWFKDDATVHEWRSGLTLSDVLRDSGGILSLDKNDSPDWIYTISVFRPTLNDQDPLHEYHSLTIHPQNEEDLNIEYFPLLPEDLLLVTRQKKAQQAGPGYPPQGVGSPDP